MSVAGEKKHHFWMYGRIVLFSFFSLGVWLCVVIASNRSVSTPHLTPTLGEIAILLAFPWVFYALLPPALAALNKAFGHTEVWQKPAWTDSPFTNNPLVLFEFFGMLAISMGIGALSIAALDPSQWWVPAFAFSAGSATLTGERMLERMFAPRAAPKAG